MESGKKALLILVSILVAFAIPILFFSESRQQTMESYITGEYFVENRLVAATVIIGLFSSDIFLPVPSSAVCAVAGKLFGVIGGTILCWIGLNLSAYVGYLFGWYLGWRAVNRFSSEQDVADVKAAIDRWGIWPIILLRPIPVAAEASILLLGTYRYRANTFWPPILIANFVFACSFVVIGVWASESGHFLIGVGVSCAVPMMMLLIWGWLTGKKQDHGGVAKD